MWDRLFIAVAKALERAAATMDPWFPGGMSYTKINVIGFYGLLLILSISLILNLILALK